MRLFVSFVPPVSGLATLHLVVNMTEDLITTIRLLTSDGAMVVAPPSPSAKGVRPDRVPSGGVNGRVLRMVRTNPRATWRVVKERTGLSEANAKRALTAARKNVRDAMQDAQLSEVLDPSTAHPNGSGN